jgi:hypothetical protein
MKTTADEHGDDSTATKEMEKLVAWRIKKGYVDVMSSTKVRVQVWV